MNNVKNYNNFIKEDFNWNIYGKKRKLVMEVIPDMVDKIKPLKDFGERIFGDMAYREFGGVFMKQKQKKYGFNDVIMYDIFNKINEIGNFIGPNLAGEFKMIKVTIWDKIFGTKSMRVVEGSSIVDHLIKLIPDFKDELVKKESDLQINKLVNSIWEIHPNNPKNKKLEESKRTEMYDEYEWEWEGEKRKGIEVNEKFFLYKAEKYKQMMINLSNIILKYKKDFIKKIEPYKEYIDNKIYDGLISKIDELYDYINGDSSNIKGEKTKLQYSIVELLDKYINKDNKNYKVFY